MFNRNHLHELERELGFSYPPSFVRRIEELNALSRTPRFARFMPGASFLLSKADMRIVEENLLPGGFIPFLAERQAAHVDYYVFDTSTDAPELQVLVFADHAVVQAWDDFDAFYAWLMAKVAAAGE